MSENDLGKAISSIIELDNLTDLPTGGEDGSFAGLDKMDSGLDQKLVVHHHPRSMEAEYFRFLKTRIEHHFGDDFIDKRCIIDKPLLAG